jgi:uncharacterized membrane protein YfcA
MAIVFGFAIAVVVSITGAGGGTLCLPVLVMAFGVPTAEAVGTSMLFATAVKLLSAPVYVIRRQFSGPALVRMLAGGLPGVVAGTLLLEALRARRLDHLVLVFVGATNALLAIASLVRSPRPDGPHPRTERAHWIPSAMLPIGVQVGMSSAGGGALCGLAMLWLTRMTVPAIVGTDLLFGLCLSLVGGGLHLALGNVNASLAAQLLAGGIAGALAGPWLATRAPARTVRTALALVLSVSGAQLFWRGLERLIGR